MELFGFVLRGAIETGVNLRYLLEHGTTDVYEAFVRDSLRLDKETHDRVNAAVKPRGGTVMPMEHMMLEGVERAFEVAGVALVPRPRGWSKGNVLGRFNALDLERLYMPYFGVQSSYAHGAWHELYEHHLAVQPDGGFLPNPDFEPLAAPPLIVALDVLAGASADYLRAAAPPCADRTFSKAGSTPAAERAAPSGRHIGDSAGCRTSPPRSRAPSIPDGVVLGIRST